MAAIPELCCMYMLLAKPPEQFTNQHSIQTQLPIRDRRLDHNFTNVRPTPAIGKSALAPCNRCPQGVLVLCHVYMHASCMVTVLLWPGRHRRAIFGDG